MPVICWVAAGAASSLAQGLVVLDEIVKAHGLDSLPPISVLMTGTVERNGKTEPFRLLATRDEKVRIEYGNAGKDAIVISNGLSFQDDGQKFTYPRTLSGFSQLDITGLFFVQQLRNRAVRVERSSELLTVAGVPTQRIRIENERAQLHPGRNKVNDSVDLFVALNGGILLATSRSFYEGRPERYTLTFTFSDYRKTRGVLLPYRIETHLKGRRTQTHLIHAYEFDVQSDRELFMARRAR